MTEFWTITEIQMLDNGAVASQTFDRSTENEARSVYHGSISAGYINGIPYHAVYLINSKRGMVANTIIDRRTDNG